MMETLTKVERRYERALPYGKQKDTRKLGRSGKAVKSIERRGMYVIGDRDIMY